MRSLVLGGNGFIGSHLCEYLARKGHQVICFDHFKKKPVRTALSRQKSIQTVKGDFRKASDLERALDGVDYVFHFIAVATPYHSVRQPEQEVTQILVPTVKLLKLCVKKKIKKIIFPSSGGLIYGSQVDPLDKVSEDEIPLPLIPHAVIKLAIEQFLHFFHRSYHLDFCVLRLSNIYGPRGPLGGGQGVVGIFLDAVLHGKRAVVLGDGQAVRDYLYIDDAVRAIALAATKRGERKIYNVGSGTGCTVLGMLNKICAVCGKKSKPVFAPARPAAIQRVVLSNARFRKEFGWKPTVTLEQGLRKVFEWVKTVRTAGTNNMNHQ